MEEQMRIEQKVENFVQRLPWRKRTQGILIDVVDACPMRCPTCPTGVQDPRDGHKMTIETFRRLLDKAQSECKVWRIQLYRFGDPLLHPEIHLFVEECEGRGIHTSLSSVLQTTRCDWQKLAHSRVHEFRVSFSGWKNMKVYQRNATPERFIEKFDMVSRLDWAPETIKTMLFHVYKDNQDEIQRAREMCEAHGFKFVALPATSMVYDHVVEGYTPEDIETNKLLLETPEENIARIRRPGHPDDFCNMQEREIVLDSYGDMRLCQAMYENRFVVGNFLAEPLEVLRSRIMRHPMCPKCKAKNVPRYMLCYADPAEYDDPVGVANETKYSRNRA
jgi:pyruvate-formate lyase-activating enzyme